MDDWRSHRELENATKALKMAEDYQPSSGGDYGASGDFSQTGLPEVSGTPLPVEQDVFGGLGGGAMRQMPFNDPRPISKRNIEPSKFDVSDQSIDQYTNQNFTRPKGILDKIGEYQIPDPFSLDPLTGIPLKSTTAGGMIQKAEPAMRSLGAPLLTGGALAAHTAGYGPDQSVGETIGGGMRDLFAGPAQLIGADTGNGLSHHIRGLAGEAARGLSEEGMSGPERRTMLAGAIAGPLAEGMSLPGEVLPGMINPAQAVGRGVANVAERAGIANPTLGQVASSLGRNAQELLGIARTTPPGESLFANAVRRGAVNVPGKPQLSETQAERINRIAYHAADGGLEKFGTFWAAAAERGHMLENLSDKEVLSLMKDGAREWEKALAPEGVQLKSESVADRGSPTSGRPSTEESLGLSPEAERDILGEPDLATGKAPRTNGSRLDTKEDQQMRLSRIQKAIAAGDDIENVMKDAEGLKITQGDQKPLRDLAASLGIPDLRTKEKFLPEIRKALEAKALEPKQDRASLEGLRENREIEQVKQAQASLESKPSAVTEQINRQMDANRPPQWQPPPGKSYGSDYETVIKNVMAERGGGANMTPIHEIRNAVRQSMGEEAAGKKLNDYIMARRQDANGWRIIPLGNRSNAPRGAIEDSIPGMGSETGFWLEPKEPASAMPGAEPRVEPNPAQELNRGEVQGQAQAETQANGRQGLLDREKVFQDVAGLDLEGYKSGGDLALRNAGLTRKDYQDWAANRATTQPNSAASSRAGGGLPGATGSQPARPQGQRPPPLWVQESTNTNSSGIPFGQVVAEKGYDPTRWREVEYTDPTGTIVKRLERISNPEAQAAAERSAAARAAAKLREQEVARRAEETAAATAAERPMAPPPNIPPPLPDKPPPLPGEPSVEFAGGPKRNDTGFAVGNVDTLQNASTKHGNQAGAALAESLRKTIHEGEAAAAGPVARIGELGSKVSRYPDAVADVNDLFTPAAYDQIGKGKVLFNRLQANIDSNAEKMHILPEERVLKTKEANEYADALVDEFKKTGQIAEDIGVKGPDGRPVVTRQGEIFTQRIDPTAREWMKPGNEDFDDFVDILHYYHPDKTVQEIGKSLQDLANSPLDRPAAFEHVRSMPMLPAAYMNRHGEIKRILAYEMLPMAGRDANPAAMTLQSQYMRLAGIDNIGQDLLETVVLGGDKGVTPMGEALAKNPEVLAAARKAIAGLYHQPEAGYTGWTPANWRINRSNDLLSQAWRAVGKIAGPTANLSLQGPKSLFQTLSEVPAMTGVIDFGKGLAETLTKYSRTAADAKAAGALSQQFIIDAARLWDKHRPLESIASIVAAPIKKINDFVKDLNDTIAFSAGRFKANRMLREGAKESDFLMMDEMNLPQDVQDVFRNPAAYADAAKADAVNGFAKSVQRETQFHSKNRALKGRFENDPALGTVLPYQSYNINTGKRTLKDIERLFTAMKTGVDPEASFVTRTLQRVNPLSNEQKRSAVQRALTRMVGSQLAGEWTADLSSTFQGKDPLRKDRTIAGRLLENLSYISFLGPLHFAFDQVASRLLPSEALSDNPQLAKDWGAGRGGSRAPNFANPVLEAAGRAGSHLLKGEPGEAIWDATLGQAPIASGLGRATGVMDPVGTHAKTESSNNSVAAPAGKPPNPFANFGSKPKANKGPNPFANFGGGAKAKPPNPFQNFGTKRK